MNEQSYYLIFGYGVSGRGVAGLLMRRNQRFFVIEDNPAALSDDDKNTLRTVGAYFGNQHDAERFMDQTAISALILSPGIAPSTPLLLQARKKNIPIVGDVEFGLAEYGGKVIGITGTNGKSSTVHLLTDMLRESGIDAEYGGNIGVSVCDIMSSDHIPAVLVLELSSYQLDISNSLKLDGGLITNITPDHIQRYESFDLYVQSKLILLERIRNYGFFVSNVDFMDFLQTYGAMPALHKKHHFLPGSKDESRTRFHADNTGLWFYDSSKGWQLKVTPGQLKCKGIHMTANAALAAEAAYQLGAEIDAISRAVRSFEGLPHRIEYVASINDVAFYNDSKATNPNSTVTALAAFAGKPVHLILGGQDKGTELTQLSQAIEQYVAALYLIGESTAYYSEYFKKTAPITECRTIEQAVYTAFQHAGPKEIVLLSPACASFDMFKNFEDRGNRFKEAVSVIARQTNNTTAHITI